MLIITYLEVKIFFFFFPFLLCFIHKKLLVSLFFSSFYNTLALLSVYIPISLYISRIYALLQHQI